MIDPPRSDAGPGPGRSDLGEAGKLRIRQAKDPYTACGRTVTYLMRIPNFARLPFGQLSRLIVGQINRGQYFFVIHETSGVVGYCGWVQTSRQAAEAWVERNVDLGERLETEGPVCVINLWQASSAGVNSAIVGGLRERISSGTELVLAKRFYPDGSIRTTRLPIATSRLRSAP